MLIDIFVFFLIIKVYVFKGVCEKRFGVCIEQNSLLQASKMDIVP